MFSFGGTELLVIGLVALLLFGPEKLPQLAKTIGRFTREFNKYKDILESTVRNEVYRAERQEESAKLEKIKAKGEAAAVAAASATAGAAGADGTDASNEDGSADGGAAVVPDTPVAYGVVPSEGPVVDAPADAAPEADATQSPDEPAADAPATASDAPVQAPAAVAATSEDEEDEG